MRNIFTVGVVIMVFVGCASTSPFRGHENGILPGSIAEFEKIKMSDGVEELVLVRGKSVTAPVLIYVHGGPGSSELVPMRFYCSGLEESFVVINWEQRGSGKLFDASKLPAKLSIDRHIEDLHEIVAWAASRFPGRKPGLVCHSWGSLLGIEYIRKYPQTVSCYIGSGQEVAPRESERLGLEELILRARAGGNAKALRELESLDSGIPYADPDDPHFLQKVQVERKWNLAFGGEIAGAGDYGMMSKAFMGTSEYSILDLLPYGLGSAYSLKALWPDFLRMDLRTKPAEFDVPVYILQGRKDLTASSFLVAGYFKTIRAPIKELVWFENSAHLPMYEESSAWMETVKRIINSLY